jgi:hypothetical protein
VHHKEVVEELDRRVEKNQRQSGRSFCLWMKRGAILAALVLFVSCARQMAPPGGPADMIAPYVIQTYPANDSVGVDIETAIRIQFSENMDRRSVEEAIFISPQSAQVPKFRWRGHELEIRLLGGLRPDRTYVITVGQASSDEWRNRMLASHTFRFSTGDVVNQGELWGRVVWSKEQIGQAFAWLYDLDVVPEPDVANDLAHYVTQPDAGGHFRFSGLGVGVYRVFVFLDADQNQTYTSGIDALAVPPQDVTVDSAQKTVRLGDLKGVVRDTSGPVLSTVRTSDQNHILMRFQEPVRIETAPTVSALKVLSVYQDVDSSRVGIVTQTQKSGQVYDVRLVVTDPYGNRSLVQTSVRGDASADKRVPEVLAIKPKLLATQIFPNAPLEMIFSDAMASDIAAPFWEISDTTLSPGGHFEWLAPNRLIFTPNDSWPIGQVRLTSKRGLVKDLAGNVLDTPVVFDFAVIDTQAVGRIAGIVDSLNEKRVVEAVSVEGEPLFYQALVGLNDSTFVIQNVLPGLYRVSGFVDANNNGLWDAGSVWPFVASEVFFSASDTVEVRARWQSDTRRFGVQPLWFLPTESKDVP